MAVQGEERANVDITKGLFISPSADSIPEGYAQRLINMFRTPQGTWAVRKGFTRKGDALSVNTHIQGGGYKTSNYSNPDTELAVTVSDVRGGNSLPHIIIQHPLISTSRPLLQHWGATNLAGLVESARQTNNYVGGLSSNIVQYKDKYYAASFTLDIMEISNFLYTSATPADYVRSNVATLIGGGSIDNNSVVTLVIYGNRIFRCEGNRVHYTEVATIGGYPTNWNSGNNFFDLPGTFCNIFNAIVLNGYLYFFTDKGIYVFSGEGSATSWSVRFLNPAPVFSTRSVALINEVFILTDRKSVKVFNGSSIQEIGLEVNYLFNVYNSFTISPFEKGFLLNCSYFTLQSLNWRQFYPADENDIYFPYTKSLYYDGTCWVEIKLFPKLYPSYPIQIIHSFVKKPVINSTYGETTYVYFYNIITKTYEMRILDREANNDASIGGVFNTEDVSPLLETRAIQLDSVEKFTKVKKIYFSIFSLNETVKVSTRKDGSYTYVNAETKTLFNGSNPAPIDDSNYLVKVRGPELVHRFSFVVNGVINNVPTVVSTQKWPTNTPSFELKKILLVGNSDERDVMNQVNA